MNAAVFLLFLFITNEVWSSPENVPWPAYFGSHYETGPDFNWGNSSRDPGGPGRFGYWASNDQAMRAQGSAGELRTPISQGDVILSVGGLGSGRKLSLVSDFLDEVRADKGATWKRKLSGRVRQVASLADASERVHWQFGNEINGPKMIRNLADWSGIRGDRPAEVMAKIIPVYVEYFLAPGVESIKATSREIYGKPDAIRVMLGSLANARNPKFIRWYEQLLSYEIKGDFAGSLRGRKVFEVVDSLSIHYLVTARDRGWADILDSLSAKWLNRGAIRRIWSTEEGGIRRARSGAGAVTALKVTARYLDWWQRNSWSTDTGRCFFWGANTGPQGTRASDALGTLYAFTGPAPLKRAPVSQVKGLESYLFDVADGHRRVFIVVPEDDGTRGTPHIDSLIVPADGWTDIESAQPWLYTTQGKQMVSATVTEAEDKNYRINFREPLVMPERSALLVLLERH
jgi:hypothetical protein